jgi:photosystem II stability/assembly factor-like uncharacterized protein
LHSQWIEVTDSLGPYVFTFASSGTNLFAGSSNGLFVSTNNGTNWAAVDSGFPPNTLVYSIVASNQAGSTNLYAATVGAGIFLSTDNGTSWNAINTGLTNYQGGVYSIAIISTNLFAGTNNSGVFRSTNNGISWTAVNSGLPRYADESTPYVSVGPLAAIGTNLFVGLPERGVFRSTDFGTSWTEVDSGLPTFQGPSQLYHYGASSFAVSGLNLFAFPYGGIFLSTDNGTTWTERDSGLVGNTGSLAFAGTNLFAGIEFGGVYLSTDYGKSWRPCNSGWTLPAIQSIAAHGTYLFAGTGAYNGAVWTNGGVWRRPLSELLSVHAESTTLPRGYTLAQNYPNPFNPTTTISFEIPSLSFVSLKVFDILGREVSTIVSEELQAGTYTRQWNAANMASGVYFYRLHAGTYSQTKQLLLLR